jgi:short-subunit dehydrogenase
MPMNQPIRDWKGQRVWVIGASSGIGRAFAQALLLRGARVALSARSSAALEEAAAVRRDAALVLPCDVTDSRQLLETYAEIKRAWSQVDLLVFMAGNHLPVRAWELEAASARQLFEVNVFGPLALLPAVIPDFVARGGGAIALVSSVAGYRGLPTSLVYGATKAALINLSETLYLDLQPKGVGVFLVSPGFVKTPLTDKNEFRMPALISPEEAAEQMLRGFARGEFEIHFPKRFTGWLKLLRLLPYRWYFPIVHRMTGL